MTATTSDQDPLEQRGILEDARREAGLDDFGPGYFLEPMAKLLDSMRREGRLSDAGVAHQRARMVSGLVARLRMFDAIRRHPEILEEKLSVPVVICGLPRTGSTMFHRMLSVAPGFTAIRWWETQNYAPFAGEVRGQPVERRKAAEKIMDAYVRAGLLSIHPFLIDEPDEEVMILDQFFVGTMPEATNYVPSFAEWLSGYDAAPAYEDLKTVLKFLQWQDRTRVGKRWVLKTPAHLSMARSMLNAFPDALLIMTHRSPLAVMPSYCSMVHTIVKMSSSEIDAATMGRFTARRWAGFLRDFTRMRDQVAADRFIDIRYDDLVAQPIREAGLVLARLGIDMSPEIEAAMQHWLEKNARDKRPAHHYSPQEFGLEREQLERDFNLYKTRFLG
jgi:hypothetical protein